MISKQLLDKLPNCKVISTIRQEDDEAAWLKARTGGIGGSDVGAICGVSPFTSARQIYLRKTGQYDDSTDNMSEASKERMHFGHMLEPIVADEYARRKLDTNEDFVGCHLVEADATFAHKDYP